VGSKSLPAEDFEELVRLHRQRIFRFALASLRDSDAAESITQDCFLKAHRSWDRFRGDSTVQTWLMKIAVNLIRDYTRRLRFNFWKRLRECPLDPLAGTSGEWIADRAMSPEERASAREQLVRSSTSNRRA
jgi:RNA polymerase sigma-70 factor (ECF subfamily)